jgi:hypothetical protein
MLMGELTAEMDWGLLVLSDPSSDFQDLPDSFRGGGDIQPLIASSDAVVISVRHGQDGPIAVRVWLGQEDLDKRGACEVGRCDLRLPSREVVVGDVLSDIALRLQLDGERYLAQINADNAIEPLEIDIVLVKADGDEH